MFSFTRQWLVPHLRYAAGIRLRAAAPRDGAAEFPTLWLLRKEFVQRRELERPGLRDIFEPTSERIVMAH